jgi:hypothetical protein
MSKLRNLLPPIALLLLLRGSPILADEPPPLIPTRDVDVTYQVSRPDQPKIIERRRWLVGEHLERVDGPDKSSTIFDRNKDEVTLLNAANRTFRKLEGSARRPPGPASGAELKRGGSSVVAGLQCVDWSWTEDVETHTVCATPDGVLLRLVVDGHTILEARSVKYGPQAAELFQVPSDYVPALAPEGRSED